MNITIIKRDGTKEPFVREKPWAALMKAVKAADEESLLNSYGLHLNADHFYDDMMEEYSITEDCPEIYQEQVQDFIETYLMAYGLHKSAKAFILKRSEHSEVRFIQERLDYMDAYADSTDNAATSSETDPNANVCMKNAANLEGEVYKGFNRKIQRARMKKKLGKMYDTELGKQYIEDLEHHIIYTNDEASTPVLKPYCMAASMYPLMLDGVGNIDGVTPKAPKHLRSFGGQVANLDFLLSSQCKGAVAFGGYFIALNYYIIAEFGKLWYEKLDAITTTQFCRYQKTVKDEIEDAFDQFVWSINQPAGNRSYQSPFTNVSYYDHTYFESLFKEFYYPDGSKPEWTAINCLQKMFMKWFNKLRLTQILTFPVETMAMVYDPETKLIIDKEYRDFTAEMYAEGHSFFTYLSTSADSLASCCRLKNELGENTFSPTSGLTGVMTGSCNVITLNINRILQDYTAETYGVKKGNIFFAPTNVENWRSKLYDGFVKYLTDILKRVYMYHIAYKTMLYEQEEKGMFTASNGGYIYISKLYSTIGINGLNEAARFLGLTVSNNPEYISFLQLVLSTIKKLNKRYSIHDTKRPFLFNSEVVPAEALGGKNYKWDKEDGYWVPQDENLYNSYFYDAHDNTSVSDKFILHGVQTYQYTDGGSALHCNLDHHLTKTQYLKLLDFACEQGTSYITFNIPNTMCKDCGHIVKSPVLECPCCGSKNLRYATRVIGYLRFTDNFGADREIEANKRVYQNKTGLEDA